MNSIADALSRALSTGRLLQYREPAKALARRERKVQARREAPAPERCVIHANECKPCKQCAHDFARAFQQQTWQLKREQQEAHAIWLQRGAT